MSGAVGGHGTIQAISSRTMQPKPHLNLLSTSTAMVCNGMNMAFATVLTFASRILLAGVFVMAGVAKLRDRGRFRTTLVAFGVPPAVAMPLTFALPIVELLIGAGLLVDAIAFGSSLAALALLFAFTAAVAVSLGRGKRPACQCFGVISSAPIGAGTLVRNAVLMAVSGVAALPADAGHLSVFDSIDTAKLAGIAVALLAGQTWLIGLLLGRDRRLSERVAALEARPAPAIKGLPPGAPAPAFTAPNLRGGTSTFESLLAPGLPVFLYFFDPDCGPCTSLLPHLTRWQAAHTGLRFVLLGRRIIGRPISPEYEPFTVLAQEDREIAALFKVPSIPSAQIIGPGGRVQSPLAVGQEAIAQIVAAFGQ